MRTLLTLALLALCACEPKSTGGGGGAGGRLAFVRSGNVWVVDDDGVTGELAVTTAGVESEPALSPNGQSVVYTHEAGGGGSEIWRTSVTGGVPARVSLASVGGSRDEAASWSPDGAKLVYGESTTGGASSLLLANTDGSGNPTPLTSPTPASFPVFSKDATLVLAVFNAGLGTVPVAGSGQLTPLQPAGLGQVLSRAVYSPDGARIAFSLKPAGGAHPKVFVMNADGSMPRQLTGTPDGDDVWPAWSFDGSFVAFQSNAGGSDNIYAETVDTPGEPKLLVGDAKTPSWSVK